MNTVFVLLFLLFAIFLVVGLIRPQAIKPKDKEPMTRKQIGLGFGTLAFACIVGGAITAPSTPDSSKVSSTQPSVTPSPKPTATSTSSPAATPTAKPTPAPIPKPAPTPAVPAEYKSALNQAGSYANTMHLSKQGVYDQLVSQYGGQFSAAAAQYAINNVTANWNANALASAKSYQTEQNLSPSAIHDQLTSSYGDKFTEAEADYAIQHLND